MPSKPNILFMIADDHRFDAIGAMGDATVQTPILDSLMARGTTFRQTHIMGSLVGAVCVPSRAAGLTSASLFRSGMQEINRDLAPSAKLLVNVCLSLCHFPVAKV